VFAPETGVFASILTLKTRPAAATIVGITILIFVIPGGLNVKWFVAAALILASAPSVVMSHDLWLEKGGASRTLYYGHKYGHRHGGNGGAELVEYDPGIVVRADCFDANGGSSAASLNGSSPVVIDGSCAVVFVMTSTGYWTKTPYGTMNVPKTDVDDALKSWVSFESVKRIDEWGDSMTRPLTQDLEITPLKNPLPLKKGKKLRLLVTFGGKPVEGATVSYGGDPRGVTGKDGRVNIKLRRNGFQVIQASLRQPYDGPDADEIIHTTNLNFETEPDK
jgi:nickel transport protein